MTSDSSENQVMTISHEMLLNELKRRIENGYIPKNVTYFAELVHDLRRLDLYAKSYYFQKQLTSLMHPHM
jgi:hypothetical protein